MSSVSTASAPHSAQTASDTPPARRRLVALALLACVALFGGLTYLSQSPPCLGYQDPRTSPYVLPYPVGTAYTLFQGNCTAGGHHGDFRYSYDFLMPIGSPVVAAREGVVAETLQGFPDGGTSENWVKIRHADGTLAAYSHLHSVLVAVGQRVQAADIIGLAGNSGQTGGVPHLHFHLSACSEPVSCGTLPVTFRNADPNLKVLVTGQSYTALPWTDLGP